MFIAGSIEDKDKLIKLVEHFEIMGCVITRKWWKFTTDKEHNYPIYVEEDIKAIKECDLFVLFNTDKKTGGKYIEIGIAIAFNKPILIYGDNITSIYRSRVHCIREKLF